MNKGPDPSAREGEKPTTLPPPVAVGHEVLGGVGPSPAHPAAAKKTPMHRNDMLAARLIELGKKLGGNSPDWHRADDGHVVGTLHRFRVECRFLFGPAYPLDHWRVEIEGGGTAGFRSDDAEIFPMRLESAQILATHVMRSRLAFDATS